MSEWIGWRGSANYWEKPGTVRNAGPHWSFSFSVIETNDKIKTKVLIKNKPFKVQKLTWKNSKKASRIPECVYSFGQWPKCLKKKNLLRKFSKIWYCHEVRFQVWKSGHSRNFLAKVKSDPKFNKSNWKIIHFRKPKYFFF